jgi:hypothetical protein
MAKDDIDRSGWSEDAFDLESNIKDIVSIATDRDEGGQPPPGTPEPDPTFAALGALAEAESRLDETAGSAHASGTMRGRRLAYALVAAFCVLTAAGAMAYLAMRSQSGVDEVAVPAVEAPQATQPSQAAAAQGSDVVCNVSPSRVAVATNVTFSDTGVADPSMFVVQWETVLTNNDNLPILVNAHRAGSGDYWAPGWEGGAVSVPPGGSQSWPATVDNNAGGTSGPLHWSYVDKVMAVYDEPACAPLAMTPGSDAEADALPVALPDLPEGVTLPAGGQ